MALTIGKWSMPHMSPTNNRLSAGFTVVELLTATILVGLVVTVFISSLLNMFSSVARQKTRLEMVAENQATLAFIERDIRLASSFETTLPTPFSDSYGPTSTTDDWTGTWSYKGIDPGNPDSPFKTLILRQTATVEHPLSTNRTPVYIKGFLANPYAAAQSTYNCTGGALGALTYNHKLPYMLIYFVRNNTLYRRTITDTTTQLCNGPQFQKMSCPRDAAQPRGAQCEAHDERLAENVAKFNITYYTQLDNPTPTFQDTDAYNSSSNDVLKDARNAVISLTTQKIIQGKTEETTQSIRVSRIN